MYPSKGSGGYGQQQYAGQQAYGQIPGAGDVGAQHAIASQQQGEVSGFRTHAAQGAQYGGPYAAVYGSSALSTAHQVGGVGGKGAASSSLQGRMGYPSGLQESSKFSSGALGSSLGMATDDYVSAATRGYAQKADPYSAVKGSDYDRRHYGDQASYETARRYADPVSIAHQHQAEMHDHIDQASLLRQQQMLKTQSLQSGSDMRQAEYLAARAQEFSSYGGRMDVDPRSLSVLGGTPYGSQHAASILGGAPRRNLDDLYVQGSSSAAYGVGLPPGRDYGAGKGLLGPPLESDYQTLSHGHPNHGVSIADDRKDDRSAYRRELELRDDDRRRELIREKDKEREKEKEREREDRDRRRDRERERERLERREKERERDLKRGRERTPPRASRDRRGSSLLKDERPARRASPRRLSPRRASPRRASPRRASPRRVSPRREAVHRRRSPVKEKKREYVCKVFPFCLVDVERDYLSLSKRYPRLSVSPECSKIVLHWPKQSLHLSLRTPVSFEHEYLELDSKGEEKVIVAPDEMSRPKQENIVWNAKVILMSGMSSNALNEMSSYKSSDEKIVHFNNILRFGILKKDHSFMAIGGPWDATIDGGDPSLEESSLVQTARRYLKDVAQLDLQNCQHWNRFLEIHYDRFGEDGLFSHKEITVLFVPDLSQCLPSLDEWRTQWLAHKKDVAERERQLAAKKLSEKKESGWDVIAGKADDTKDASKESNKKNAVDHKGKEPVLDEKSKEGNAEEAGLEGKSDVKQATDGANLQPAADNRKPVKKKIIKKVVKGKVAAKKATDVAAGDATTELGDKMDVGDDGDKHAKQASVIKEDTADPVNVKTFIRKKLVKKVPAKKSASKADAAADSSSPQTEKKPELEVAIQNEKTPVKKEPDESLNPVETVVKTTGKKKIIRRVVKKKVPGTGVKDVNSNTIKKEPVKEEDNGVTKTGKGEETKDSAERKDEVGASKSKEKIKEESKTAEKGTNETKTKAEKESSKSSTQPEVGKTKDKKDDHHGKKEKVKDEKEKSKDPKHDTKQKSQKEKEKAKPEEPPKHPGLFLCTKRNKGSKMRSMSLSLDGLLDYNDKDIEESTFELSVFAESLNEMLQYQMGCRLLEFLEKLRKRFIVKRNQRKRQRDEKSEKEKDEGSLKRHKMNDDIGKESPKSGKQDNSNENQDGTVGEDGAKAGKDEAKMEAESDDDNGNIEEENKSDEDDDNDDDVEEEEEEEDPEEIIEDDQEMDDVDPPSAGVQEPDGVAKKADLGAAAGEESGKKTVNEMNSKTETVEEKSDKEKEDDKQRSEAKSDSSKEVVFDKELLQAFRYFDHNRVGYIKVEDMRCLLHNLGKFISHRDVKELVQSALFESNSAMDNRIFYKKLVKLTDL